MSARKKISQEFLNNDQSDRADLVSVTYYTDPLCCWSWALQDAWNKALQQFNDAICVQYVMCGMIQSWQSFQDPLNNISTPAQMGPLWMHASQITQTAIATDVWHNDPPASSFPACIAVKCAEYQSSQAGHILFNRLQKAVMVHGHNISREDVIMDIAEALEKEHPAIFHLARFKADQSNGTGKKLLKADIQQALYHRISRYPTITFTHPERRGIMIIGYRPYDVLLQAFRKMIN